MNELQKILTEMKPVHSYRVKFAFEPTKEELHKVVTRLTDRYDAFEIGALLKTIFQVNPPDFPNLDCGEIWIFDFKCYRGIQPDMLQFEIGSMLKVSEALIHVRNKNEPYQEEISTLEDETDLDFDEYEPRLLDPEHNEVPEINQGDYVGQDRINTVLDLESKKQQKEPVYFKYMAAGFQAKE